MEIKAVDPEFVRVWSRVKAPADRQAPSPPEPPGDFIPGKLRAELERRRRYLELGLYLPASESLRRAKRLRTAWFICTGEHLWPNTPGVREPASSRSEALRQLYLAEELSERDYLAAREGCPSDMLRDVFAQCAQGCRNARQELWTVMENSPGR